MKGKLHFLVGMSDVQDPCPSAISCQWGLGSHWDLLMYKKFKSRTITGWTQSLELLGRAQDEQGQQNAVSSENLLLSSSHRLLEAGSQLLYWHCRAKKTYIKTWLILYQSDILKCNGNCGQLGTYQLLNKTIMPLNPNVAFSTCLSFLPYTSYVSLSKRVWKRNDHSLR